MSDREGPDTGRRVTVYADGASRGNPGPASIGAVVLAPDGAVLAEVSAAIGVATNNVAEYQALIAGLKAALGLGATSVAVRMDSELIVRQLLGVYKVKNPGLLPLYRETVGLLDRFRERAIGHVPRNLNRIADALANRALDEQAELGRT